MKFVCLFVLLCAHVSICSSQKLPTPFTGVVQIERVAKKGDPNTAPHSPLVNGCFNQHECCHTLYTMGHCVHSRSDMKIWCPEACSFCEPGYNSKLECKDRLDCRRLVAQGGCKEFEYFMTENCRKSCDKCEKSRAEICPGARRDCSLAPNPGLRRVCEQLQRWDEGARRSTILGPEVALPPGSTSLADLGRLN